MSGRLVAPSCRLVVGLVVSGRLVAPSCRLVVGLVAYFTQILGPVISSRFIVTVTINLLEITGPKI